MTSSSAGPEPPLPAAHGGTNYVTHGAQLSPETQYIYVCIGGLDRRFATVTFLRPVPK